jgi:transcriptional regulator with XRE-family HTH domain
MLIQGVREEKGRSIEETARLAGMTVSEWEEIEAGRMPSTREQLAVMADALEVDWNGMASLAVFCRQAWGR